jgi:integrase
VATFQRRGRRVRAIVRRINLHASKSFSSLADAKLWANFQERRADLAGVLPSGPAEGTLGQLIARYEREIWPLKRWGRNKAYELRRLNVDLGDKPLASLSKQVFVDYAQDVAKRKDRAGVTGRLSYLRVVLVVSRDLWNMSTPVVALDEALAVLRHHKIVGRGVPRTRRPLPAELDAIVAYAETQTRASVDLAAVVHVLQVLPLRIGELCGIEWDDLRPDERAVVIRSRKHPDRAVKDASVDLVPLPVVGGTDTFQLIADRPRYYTKPFSYDAHTVSSAFSLATKSCGIKNLHLHDLRAHALSKMLAAGVPVPVVAQISGHRNWRILASTYARLEPAEAHAAFARAQATSKQATE